jgi:hypothetical protein
MVVAPGIAVKVEEERVRGQLMRVARSGLVEVVERYIYVGIHTCKGIYI